ncbi:hypothetical protein Clacol_000928 [Clathrus columnatus]|uniref:Uncharacterized protein n=1 Tax=Clathrus columnatus TaxID=1419009 RepID=A0AAV5A010_9AGAM|nr:hypothetical protein Clacol_000928 [Clathrus columnatus]
MGSQLNLSGNDLAAERMEKANKIMLQWYETVLQFPLPSLGDPGLISQFSSTGYFWTKEITTVDGWKTIHHPYIIDHPMISVDWKAINNTVLQVLADTTGKDTGQGYGSGVIKSFDGRFDDKKCLYKVILVANVAVFGYRIDLFHTDPPFGHADHVSTPIDAIPLAYTIPNDMSVIGRRFMTVEELDRYN